MSSTKKEPPQKTPMNEKEMKLRWIGGISLWKMFAVGVSIPTVLIGSMVLLLQDGGEFKVTHKVFFDIEIAGKAQERLVIGLFGDTVPRTVQNFLTFATDGFDGKKYQGSRFHRVIKNFMIQGGDVVNGDGSGSLSIFGPIFPDENFEVKHTGPGYLSMANSGPDRNGCQFFITTASTSWLDGKHVVFGKVIGGEKTLEAIEFVPVDLDNNRPKHPVAIVKSGRLPVKDTIMISNDPYNFKEWAITIAPSMVAVACVIAVFNKLNNIFDRGMNIDKIIEEELKEKAAQDEAEAMKQSLADQKNKDGVGEVIKGSVETSDQDNVRRRQME